MYCRPMYSVFTIDIVAYAYTHCFKITQNVEFEFWHFPPIFVQLQMICLVTLFDRIFNKETIFAFFARNIVK